jgi:hypothetical protein
MTPFRLKFNFFKKRSRPNWTVGMFQQQGQSRLIKRILRDSSGFSKILRDSDTESSRIFENLFIWTENLELGTEILWDSPRLFEIRTENLWYLDRESSRIFKNLWESWIRDWDSFTWTDDAISAHLRIIFVQKHLELGRWECCSNKVRADSLSR